MTLHRWHRRAVATVAAAVVLPALSLLTPSAASAQELRFADPRHDVQTIDAAVPSLDLVVDPTHSNGDITSAFIHFRKGRLVARINFAELTPRKNEIFSYSGVVLTRGHHLSVFNVSTLPGRYAGHDMLVNGRRKSCEIGHKLDWKNDFARVAIPLSCLGHPHSVRLAFGAVTVTADTSLMSDPDLKPGQVQLHIDMASPNEKDELGLTPRIRVPRHGWTA